MDIMSALSAFRRGNAVYGTAVTLGEPLFFFTTRAPHNVTQLDGQN